MTDGVPTLEEVHLDPKRRRVLGYPVITMTELTAIAAELPYDTVIIRDGKLDLRVHLYGLPVLTEVEADALERAWVLLKRIREGEESARAALRVLRTRVVGGDTVSVGSIYRGTKDDDSAPRACAQRGGTKESDPL